MSLPGLTCAGTIPQVGWAEPGRGPALGPQGRNRAQDSDSTRRGRRRVKRSGSGDRRGLRPDVGRLSASVCRKWTTMRGGPSRPAHEVAQRFCGMDGRSAPRLARQDLLRHRPGRSAVATRGARARSAATGTRLGTATCRRGTERGGDRPVRACAPCVALQSDSSLRRNRSAA